MEELQGSNAELRNLLTVICRLRNTEAVDTALLQLKEILRGTSDSNSLQIVQNLAIVCIKCILTRLSEGSIGNNKKLEPIIVDVLQVLLEKTKVESLEIFLFSYHFFLKEIYDHSRLNTVANVSEEYKLAIVQGVMSLFKSLSWDVGKVVYVKEYVLTFSPMVYVLIQLAKNEQLRCLRITAINCFLLMAKIDDESDPTDIEIRKQVADTLMFFAPGIFQAFAEIAVEDEKRSQISILAIKAWGRMVALQMQNYNAADHSIHNRNFDFTKSNTSNTYPQTPWRNRVEAESFLRIAERSPEWYQQTDKKLEERMHSFSKLTHHSYMKVRLEFMHSCLLIIEFCSTTIPATISKIIETLIILSEDSEEEISKPCKLVLVMISEKFSLGSFQLVMEHLEENFFGAISGLPRVFNSLDEKEQLASLNLLVGYLRLFGKNSLSQVLHSSVHLNRLLQTLIQFCELEQKDVSLCEEYMIQDLDLVVDHRTPWKVFRYFCDVTVQQKLENACALIAECNVLDMTTDVLLDIFLNSEENRKEATFILNCVLAGITDVSNEMYIVKHVINTYLDPQYWNLCLEVSHTCMLPQVKTNIIQICLQVEGLSKIALALKGEFNQYLLKVLYPILERAGSGHPLIKSAGIMAITSVSVACGYANVAELINANSDYFSYHVVRKIQKTEYNESVLNVLAMVMKYSGMEILDYLSDIISGVLLQTCDNFFQECNANAYLRVFQMFVKCLIRWANIKVQIRPIKSKRQKEMEYEDFQISNLNIDSNQYAYNMDANKTAEEMYREDLQQRQKEETTGDFEQSQEYKQAPPKHVELASWLLQRCINFLPSKDRARKILVLEILKDGVEIIRDWDDVLLPLVHQIWSPLINRFKEKNESLIINYSFQLLVTLARLSKDFIRSRTAKDVLPQIKSVLLDLSQLSHAKDTGATYRYTQAYKLQLTILQQLARVMIDLDLNDCYINEMMDVVAIYLSNLQPLPLQSASMYCFCDIAKFDREMVQNKLQKFLATYDETTKIKYVKNIQAVLLTI